MSDQERARPDAAPEVLEVEAHTHRRTALVALRGELDLAGVPRVAEVLDGLAPHADGLCHIVVDLRRLTFMDSSGLHELIRQDRFARESRHNIAFVRGPRAVEQLLRLTKVENFLVLVDEPEDLAPPRLEPVA
ncbi:MAG: STAS domain-containing protein [Solirubrobacteraceae bacterium]